MDDYVAGALGGQHMRYLIKYRPTENGELRLHNQVYLYRSIDRAVVGGIRRYIYALKWK